MTNPISASAVAAKNEITLCRAAWIMDASGISTAACVLEFSGDSGKNSTHQVWPFSENFNAVACGAASFTHVETAATATESFMLVKSFQKSASEGKVPGSIPAYSVRFAILLF